jgi:hypothetical protein
MRKPFMAIASVMILFAFGCSGSPVEPVADGVPPGTGDQAQFEAPDVEPLSHGKAEDLPLRGFDMSEWKFVGATAEELHAVGTSVGFFSHMGRSTGESEFKVSLANGVSEGTTTWTTANGDKITTTWTSTPTSVSGRLLEITTTGGTGRFANASGFTVGELTILTSDATGGTSEATYQGTTTY